MRVLVECYHDIALARALGVQVRRIGHERSKGNVLGRLARWNGPAVGIIDADPGSLQSNPREMANYQERERIHGLQLLEHRRDQSKLLVVIDPRLEEWLVAHAEGCDIRLQEFGLPATAQAMHKNPRCDLKPGFGAFLTRLVNADQGMRLLKQWVHA